MVELGYKEYKEFLRYFYPPKNIPTHIIELCNNIDNALNIVVNEVSVYIQNSLFDILKYLKKKGYNIHIIEIFVIKYKDELLRFNNKGDNGNN